MSTFCFTSGFRYNCGPMTNRLQKAIQHLAASRGGSWILLRVLPPIDRVFFRLSGNRHTLVSLLAGLPTLLLVSTGAKSGQPRTTPLVGIPHGDGYILIGSNFGQTHHPAWVYNLRAHPCTHLVLNGQTREYTAREVHGQEYDMCWQKAVSSYAGYEAYKARAQREIALFVFEPNIKLVSP
jgi:deazaflavin-dependent oxidoreductase (nitroreductase family)